MAARNFRRVKVIGYLLIVLCVTVLPIYLLLVFYPSEILGFFGLPIDGNTGIQARMYAALIPVVVGLSAALLAGAWIGLSIVTSPPPKKTEEEDKAQ